MRIYLDFDGTVVEHDYPSIGRCNFGCIEVLKKLEDAGHEIILNTMRCEFNDGSLEKAKKWFTQSWMFTDDREIELKPFKCTEKKIHPHAWDWDYHVKQNELFIDDIGLGIPLKPTCMIHNGLMVDWNKINREFEEYGMYNKIAD